MKQEPISLWALSGWVFATMVPLAFQTLPRAVALSVSTAAPWVMLVAGAAALLFFWPVAGMLSRRPGANLTDLAQAAGGRPLAIATALLLGAVLVAGEGIALRETSELFVTAIFPYTPQTFGMSTLVVAAAIGAGGTPQGIAWQSSLVTPIIVAAIVLVLLGNIGWGQFRNVLPMTGNGILPVAGQVLPLTSYFGELITFAVFCRHVATPRHLGRAAALVVAGTALLWAGVVLLYLMVFPLPGGLAKPFPLFEMTRLVQGGRYLERLDAVWMFFWTTTGAGLMATALTTAAHLFKEAFRLPSHRPAVLPLSAAMLAVALFPSNQAGAIDAEAFLIRRWGFLITLVMPMLIAAVAHFRLRWASGGPGAPSAQGDARA